VSDVFDGTNRHTYGFYGVATDNVGNVEVLPTTAEATTTVDAPCFAAGTRIETERGEVAVEAIGVGDMVRVLLGDGLAPVIWVGLREVIAHAISSRGRSGRCGWRPGHSGQGGRTPICGCRRTTRFVSTRC
jgi:hypothetical protein